MSVPMRKDDFVEKDELIEENLTTADLALSKRPASTGGLLSDDRSAGALERNRVERDRIENDRTENDYVENDRANPELARNDVVSDVRRDAPGSDRPGPVLAERPMVTNLQTTSVDAKTIAAPNAEVRNASGTTPLFPTNELEELRSRWNDVQTAFVDEPRRAVEQADGLVASAMKRLAEVFAEERSRLEHQWDRGDDVSTEDLRIALQRYRSFFQRLLAI
jgi:hypothetical protein